MKMTEHQRTLWVCLAVQIASLFAELGLPTFIALSLYLMWLNTSTEKRHGPSAYSVFNQNQEAIQGSMSAKQFEDELYRKMY